MIARKSAFFCLALILVMTGIGANYALLLHPLPLAKTAFVLAAPTLTVALVWGLIWGTVRLSYSKQESLDPAYVAYFSRCLSVFAVWMTIVYAYFMLFAPLTGGKPMATETYNRAVMIASGLILAGLGNIVPKLPYQRFCGWLEIGPERTYRVNRLGGWLMVVVGAAETALGLMFPLPDTLFYTAASAGLAVVLLPYIWLHYINIRQYRRETLNGKSA
jgi:hypothetical protein